MIVIGMKSLASLLCVSSVVVIASGTATKTWQDYLQVFGGVLTGACSHIPTLEVAYKFASVQHAKHPTRFDLRYDCAPYEVGGDIARKCRLDQSVNCSILPVLVDQEEDIMCFLDIHDNTVKDPVYFHGFDKVLGFLGPLKIHDSIYLHVDGKVPFLNIANQVLDVSFRHEVFGAGQDEAVPAIENAIKSGLVAVKSHPLTQLKEEFFWSAPSTKEYFTEKRRDGNNDFGDNEKFEKDYARFKSWHSVLEPLVHYEEVRRPDDQSDDQSEYNYDFNEYAYSQRHEINNKHSGAELCGLEEIADNLRYRPVSSLVNHTSSN